MISWCGWMSPCCHGYWMTLPSWETQEVCYSAHWGSVKSMTHQVRLKCGYCLFIDLTENLANLAWVYSEHMKNICFWRLDFLCRQRQRETATPVDIIITISGHLLAELGRSYKLLQFNFQFDLVKTWLCSTCRWFQDRRQYLGKGLGYISS